MQTLSETTVPCSRRRETWIGNAAGLGGYFAALVGGIRASHEPDPSCAGPGEESKCDEAEGDDTEQDVSERLTEKEKERAAEALDLGRVVLQAGLDHKPANDQEYDTTGEHPEAAQSDRDRSLCLGDRKSVV